ncbi:MAG: lipid-A-disaccharide synthase [Bacteroidaceae bacterium]|nr:lipid-A-disaccharide synthase [Bacteroidaceae bacterium]
MKYYLIAGEASGDVHASHLIASIKQEDAEAQFRCFGGDMMKAQGAELVQHYRDLAYMGFLQVIKHLPTIFRGMKRCREDILEWQPNALILVDYPGFNLRIARFIKQHSTIPVFYYIAPKIWAWKEHRIRNIKRDIDQLFSILPFEKDFYERKHHYPIYYVGNPTVDEVDAYLKENPANAESFRKDNNLDERPIIALLAGSRKQEVRDNLRRMVEAAEPYSRDYQLVLAAAPGLEDEFYEQQIKSSMFNLQSSMIKVVRDQTFRLLQHSTAALVTSGTATLETALLRVPQVVCYYIRAGRLATLARRLFLKIPYISLVNLVSGKEVVPELVAEQMTPKNVRQHLASILPGGSAREAQLQGYERMAVILGESGAPVRAAKQIVCLTPNN